MAALASALSRSQRHELYEPALLSADEPACGRDRSIYEPRPVIGG
jgi:hypothetical protein